MGELFFYQKYIQGTYLPVCTECKQFLPQFIARLTFF